MKLPIARRPLCLRSATRVDPAAGRRSRSAIKLLQGSQMGLGMSAQRRGSRDGTKHNEDGVPRTHAVSRQQQHEQLVAPPQTHTIA